VRRSVQTRIGSTSSLVGFTVVVTALAAGGLIGLVPGPSARSLSLRAVPGSDFGSGRDKTGACFVRA
jgi:hypothetical protein